MIKVALVCDNCGELVAVGISASEVWLQAEALYRRRERKDLCLACESTALATPAPVAPDHRVNAERRRHSRL
jgi:hypothetical protein